MPKVYILGEAWREFAMIKVTPEGRTTGSAYIGSKVTNMAAPFCLDKVNFNIIII